MDGFDSIVIDVSAALTSWLALRVYVLAAAATLLATSFWFAKQQRGEIIPHKKKKGPTPKKRETILKHIAEFERHKKLNLRALQFNFFNVILFGFVVPSAILVLVMPSVLAY